MTKPDPQTITRPSFRSRTALPLLLALAVAAGLAQQSSGKALPFPVQDNEAQPTASSPASDNSPRCTVRGVVRNGLSGEGVARALVQIEGDARTGVLTAGDGSFELPDVPAGPQTFTVIKPGYQDRPWGGATVEKLQSGEGRGAIHATGNHNVVVAASMPELNFTLSPAAAIEGTVRLANGEPAPGINVELAQRVIESGRQVWQLANQVRTRAGGGFRLGGLTPGAYALFTAPFLDADAPRLTDDEPETDADTSVPREALGYAALYFPDAHEPGGLAPIELAAGQTQQLNITLTPELLHRVTVGIVSRGQAGSAQTVRGSLLDAAGHALEYRTSWDARTSSVVALLPDGTYQMLLTTTPQTDAADAGMRRHADPHVALVEFTVAGKPLTVPRVALVEQQPPPVEVNNADNGLQAARDPHRTLVILANPDSGWIDDSVVSAYASGPSSGPLEASYTTPGAYWLHPQMAQDNLCEDALAASGASMAREPVHVALGGSTPPLTLSLRHDCARLTLHLPASVMGFLAGEEPYYTAYVVPDFDFTHDLNEVTLRPTSGESLTVAGLTPGRYRVYSFAGPQLLAYHDPSALAKLPSQEVTLPAGGTAELTLEVAGHE